MLKERYYLESGILMKDCMELYYQKLPSPSPSVCQDFIHLISFYLLPPWQWVLLLLASLAAVERETQGAM